MGDGEEEAFARHNVVQEGAALIITFVVKAGQAALPNAGLLRLIRWKATAERGGVQKKEIVEDSVT